MTSLLTMVPPGVFLIGVALMIALFERRLAYAIGTVTTGLALLWILFVPAGDHLAATFLGNEVVLFSVTPVSRFMGITFAFIASVTTVYAYASGSSSRLMALLVAYAGTGMGTCFAGDWLTLLVFWELMLLGSLFLIWSSGGPAVRAGFRYAVFHGIGGVCLLLAIGMQFAAVDTFLITGAGIEPGPPAILAAVGIGINAGFVGGHTWLPDSYPKTNFVTTVVLAGYTTKAAVYALHRAFPDGHLLVAYMGGAMAVFGVTYALLQTDMRLLLTYHIQSQVGYMVAGIGLGSALGIAGGFFHLFNNVLYKSLLFMIAGVIIYRTGEESLKKVGGLGRTMPLTFLVFAVAALSIVGVPGFNGFVSKAMVKSAAEAEHLEALSWLFIAAGVGTAASFAKFGYYAFIRESPTIEVPEATRLQLLSMGAIAVPCVLYGLFPGAIYGLLPGTNLSVPDSYTFAKIAEALLLTTGGIVAFALLKPTLAKIKHAPDLNVLYDPIAFYGLRWIAVASVAVASAVDTVVNRLVRTGRAFAVGGESEQLAHLFPDGVWPSDADITALVLAIVLLTTVLLLLL